MNSFVLFEVSTVWSFFYTPIENEKWKLYQITFEYFTTTLKKQSKSSKQSSDAILRDAIRELNMI
jgi:hypothetical protein